MKLKCVGIIAPAYNIEANIISRFTSSYKSSLIELGVDECVSYYPMSDQECLVDGQFSRSKALNSGIKYLMNSCEVIICTDIDMIIPPELIDYSYHKAKQTNNNIFSMARFIDNQKKFNWDLIWNIPASQSGLGGWNAMTIQSWIKLGGWNEELVEWGYEDHELHSRIKSKSIGNITCKSYPLVHINHPVRNQSQTSSQNKNIKIVNSKSWDDYNWLI